MSFLSTACILLTFSLSLESGQCTPQSEKDAAEYLDQLESRYSNACNKEVTKKWNYNINVNPQTSKEMIDAKTEFSKFQAEIQQEILERFPNWKQFQNETIKRQLKYLSIKGTASMPIEAVEKMNLVQHEMDSSFATALLCGYKDRENCTYRPNEELKEILKNSKDPKELSYYWTAWYDKMSDLVPPSKYHEFVQYQLKVAKANGFNDMTEMWLANFEDGSPDWSAGKFKQQMWDLWEEIRPLFETIHAYVRMKLRRLPEFDGLISECGYIPMYVTGSRWGQSWSSISERTKPHPNVPSVDATDAMNKQKYTPKKIYDLAEKFFIDLGMLPMTETFWEKSVLERPTDGRHVVHTAQAEDFCLGKKDGDFRIKQYTEINMEGLVTAHHESGHVQYNMQYAQLPYAFRDAANPGFHEAIGDTLALAVVTPKHLQCSLGLDLNLSSLCGDSKPGPSMTETDINYLYRSALDKLPVIPFSLAMETWRWEAFEGKLTPDQYNSRWWDLILTNLGLSPSHNRSLPNLFDPAAKFHTVGNVPVIPYFLSYILQFQFYEAMCIAAGEFDPSPNSTSRPLHQCDFDGNKRAGKLLGDTMRLGFSKAWPVALETLTGTKEISVAALKRYFKPLLDYISTELEENSEIPGYGSSCEHMAEKYLTGQYERRSTALVQEFAQAEWKYLGNLTTENSAKASEATVALAHFEREQWKRFFRHFNTSLVESPQVKRQLELSRIVGSAALPNEKVKRLADLTSNMSQIYGTAKVCPFDKQDCDTEKDGLSLNPGIEKILHRSRNYDELAYFWTAWRNATGRKMRSMYYEYIDLENEGARLNGLKTATDVELFPYETPDFKEVTATLWEQVKPLFVELHGYVRFKLREIYPRISENGPLPAHVFGNMWSQSWDYLADVMTPYPSAKKFNATEGLLKRFSNDSDGLTKMFDAANEFFASLGLYDLSEAYGPKAMISRPKDREVDCHGSAWDMADKVDFRLLMCTNINEEDFSTIHHELGHIVYMKAYKDLPSAFRNPANPGFTEAIGDVISLSVRTPQHMSKIGLIDKLDSVGEESTINFLMGMGLAKIALLPFTYMLDHYRWQIFDGQIPKSELNYHWVKMVSDYQGIVPPVKRTESDFDPGAKYHVAVGAPYICYFVSHIVQFQIFKGLCEAAGQYPARPLHECDIYGSKEAGAIIKKMLERGASQHWGKTLQEAIGTEKMESTGILEYFDPLLKYLTRYRETKGYTTGWSETAFKEFVQ